MVEQAERIVNGCVRVSVTTLQEGMDGRIELDKERAREGGRESYTRNSCVISTCGDLGTKGPWCEHYAVCQAVIRGKDQPPGTVLYLH
jgi:hypothetical protein